jgi:hypothetical protein
MPLNSSRSPILPAHCVLKLYPEINIQPPTPLFSFSPRRLARDVLKSPLETDIQLPAPLTLDDLSWMGIVVK